jgi:peptidyl-tRNA hydrolase, PTH1 family
LFGLLQRLFGRRALDPLAGLDPPSTRLIVGLGNPGAQYARTRHNLGFLVVDALARQHGAEWRARQDELQSLVAVIRPAAQRSVVLAKPLTFMNRSGLAVATLVDALQLQPAQTLVVYDDMDLPWRSLRLRPRGSPGTHNGMRSVVGSLGTDAIPRLRVGISQASPGQAIAHVLSEFTPEERESVQDLIDRSAAAAVDWALHGAAAAMNRYNSLNA